jgi:uncharacterized SAM-binding protein YcdF (DUF218 family)
MITTPRVTRVALALAFLISANVSARAIDTVQPQADYHQYISERQTVDFLIQDALTAFKSPARVSDAGFTGKLPTNMETVADRLQQASKLEPYRADLLFSTASAYIYNNNVDKALELYKQILEIAPDDVDAHSYIAAWDRFKGDTAGTDAQLAALQQLNPGRVDQLKKVFAVIDHVTTMPLRDHLPVDEAKSFTGPTAIVTLGYALDPDGSMNKILIQRLEKTLELAKQLPDAMIVVTGGVPQNHQTEGKLMAQWLVEKGVDSKRIYQDNFARSTVENALFSRYALAKHRIKNAVIVSSGSHVRRSQALFTIASWETGPRDIKYVSVAAIDKPLAEMQSVSQGDKQGIYRDALKTMGLWSFRSYPLEER